MLPEKLRLTHKPDLVRVLFVGESAPAGGTFFYASDSNLYKYTRKAFELAAFSPEVGGGTFLDFFRWQGCYLLDLCEGPVNGLYGKTRRSLRREGVPRLIKSVNELEPSRVVVVMKGIQKEVKAAVRASCHPDLEVSVVPFPAQGHQRRFVHELEQILRGFISEGVFLQK